jgi:hypothetical protein
MSHTRTILKRALILRVSETEGAKTRSQSRSKRTIEQEHNHQQEEQNGDARTWKKLHGKEEEEDEEEEPSS